jgi:hypothetical protein
MLARSINYILYAVPPTDLRAAVAQLPPEAMRASLSCANVPAAIVAGGREKLDVLVRNTGGAEWPAVGDAEGRNAVRLRDRWLKTDGTVLTDEDAAARIPFDMEPGDTAGLALNVYAPNERLTNSEGERQGFADTRGAIALTLRALRGYLATFAFKLIFSTQRSRRSLEGREGFRVPGGEL